MITYRNLWCTAPAFPLWGQHYRIEGWGILPPPPPLIPWVPTTIPAKRVTGWLLRQWLLLYIVELISMNDLPQSTCLSCDGYCGYGGAVFSADMTMYRLSCAGPVTPYTQLKEIDSPWMKVSLHLFIHLFINTYRCFDDYHWISALSLL